MLPEVLPSQRADLQASPMFWNPGPQVPGPLSSFWGYSPEAAVFEPKSVPEPPGLVEHGCSTPRRRTADRGLEMTPPKVSLPPMVLKLSDIVCKNDNVAAVSHDEDKEVLAASPGSILLQMLRQGEASAEGKALPGRRRRRGGRGRGRGGKNAAGAEAHEGEESGEEAPAKSSLEAGEATPSTVASDGDAREASMVTSSEGNDLKSARRGKNGAPRVASSPGSVWI